MGLNSIALFLLHRALGKSRGPPSLCSPVGSKECIGVYTSTHYLKWIYDSALLLLALTHTHTHTHRVTGISASQEYFLSRLSTLLAGNSGEEF